MVPSHVAKQTPYQGYQLGLTGRGKNACVVPPAALIVAGMLPAFGERGGLFWLHCGLFIQNPVSLVCLRVFLLPVVVQRSKVDRYTPVRNSVDPGKACLHVGLVNENDGQAFP